MGPTRGASTVVRRTSIALTVLVFLLIGGTAGIAWFLSAGDRDSPPLAAARG